MKKGSERAFIDTNVLIYAAAADEPVKQPVARALVGQLMRDRAAVISTQVLNEFCSVLLRKYKVDPSLVREHIATYSRLEVVTVTPAIILDAVDIHQTRRVNYYDALMVAAAKAAGCVTLYTEDMNGGERIDQVKLVDPFKSAILEG